MTASPEEETGMATDDRKTAHLYAFSFLDKTLGNNGA